MSVAKRRFNSEISNMIDNNVILITSDGKSYNGKLVGVDLENLSIVLFNVKNPEGQIIPKAVFNGNIVSQLFSIEKAFDLRGLSERLERVFPRMVKLYEKEGFIWVMDRIKVSEEGLMEGSGPSAERVQRVFNQFIREIKEE
jgi:small nuclear ribonucleoprotein (snRNP)-like protein